MKTKHRYALLHVFRGAKLASAVAQAAVYFRLLLLLNYIVEDEQRVQCGLVAVISGCCPCLYLLQGRGVVNKPSKTYPSSPASSPGAWPRA
jgi:hypothetical protein